MEEKQRTTLQNKALHKGCQNIADLLVEHGISLTVALKNLDVRPTMYTIKDAFRSVAKAKYGVDSTAQLSTSGINGVWVDLTKAISEATGLEIEFPSQDSFINYDDKI
jgi:hypothetical protein